MSDEHTSDSCAMKRPHGFGRNTLTHTLVLTLGFLVAGVVHAETIRVPRDYPTIQAGIDAANDGDKVVVADGVYTGDGNRDIDFKGKAIIVRSKNGPENCIIDCQGSENDPHRGFYFHSGEGSDSVLQGFTVINGYASTGAGLYCENSSPTVTRCAFTKNRSGTGAGASLKNSSPTFDTCIFSDNSSFQGGGLDVREGGSPTIIDCVFSRNGGTAPGSHGGAIVFQSASATIIGCTITGNAASATGGINILHGSKVTITNCLIADNRATGSAPLWGATGGVLCSNGSSVTLTNCTITGNSATTYGGGVLCYWSGTATLANCILWGNRAPNGAQIALVDPQNRGREGGSLGISYGTVQGGEEGVYVAPGNTLIWGEGNIDADPLFASGPLGDFYLSHKKAGQDEDSLCVNAGNGRPRQLGLKKTTTRTDGVKDKRYVDMGYHYPR